MKLKKSKKRDRIYDLVCSVRSHPTAEWVYFNIKNEIPEISLATVYRNLEQLCYQGKIMKIEGDDGVLRFDGFTENHYHVNCSVCNMVFDLDIEYNDKLIKEMCVDEKFDITSYNLSFSGICPGCKKGKTVGYK